MRDSAKRSFSPTGSLKIARLEAQSVTLKGSGQAVEISVLAPDQFRLRVARGKRLTLKPSWAVIKTDWPQCPVTIHHAAGRVTLVTRRAKFTLWLKSGRWELADAAKRPLFSAAAGATGFYGEEPTAVLSLAEGRAFSGWAKAAAPSTSAG